MQEDVPANCSSAKPKAPQVAVKQLKHNYSADFCMEAGKQLREATLPLSHNGGPEAVSSSGDDDDDDDDDDD